MYNIQLSKNKMVQTKSDILRLALLNNENFFPCLEIFFKALFKFLNEGVKRFTCFIFPLYPSSCFFYWLLVIAYL